MKTTTKNTPATANLTHSITVITAPIIGENRTGLQKEEKTVIKIRLNDECKNGHEDFSLTFIVYEGDRDVAGGCNHEHILSLRPDLKPFADLHLSDAEGAPMHAIGNALYWYAGTLVDGCGQEYHGGSGRNGKTGDQCLKIFLSHIRGTQEDFNAIDLFGPRTAGEMSYILESLGFRARWKKEAKAAIKAMEKMTGQKFKSAAVRKNWKPLSKEEAELIESRRASGYYTPEAIAARDAESKEAAKVKKLEKINAEYSDTVAKATKKRDIALFFASREVDDKNVIFYDHVNEVTFNWSTCAKLWSHKEFESFSRTVSSSDLPEGVTLRFQEKPRA